MLHFGVSLTDNSRVIIYDRKMFIILAIGCADDAKRVSIRALSIMDLILTHSINDAQYNDTQNNILFKFKRDLAGEQTQDLSIYTECHYAEFNYAI
jgi:hypothetical protein